MKKNLTLLSPLLSLSFCLVPTGLCAREPQIKVKQVLQTTRSGAGMLLAGQTSEKGRIAVEKKTRGLPELMGRIKLATSPASRCFLVALFIFGFTSSYVANLPSNTHPQNSATLDVGNHSPEPAFVFVRGAFANASGWDHVVRVPERDGHTVTLVQNPLITFADDQADHRSPRTLHCDCGTLVWQRGYQPCCY